MDFSPFCFCVEGFRLIAVSMLPLAEGSLIYGSEDAGITVHAKGLYFLCILCVDSWWWNQILV